MGDSPTYTKEPFAEQPAAVRASPSTMEVREIDTQPRQTGRRDTNEAPAGEETKPPEEKVQLDSQTAALAKKEAKIRQAEQTLRAKEQKLIEDQKRLERLERLEKALANKDYSGVEDLVNYDEYTNYLLEKQKTADPNAQAIQKLNSEIAEMKKADQQRLNQQFDAAVSERKSAIAKLVDSNPEDYSAIKELKRHDAVIQHILDTWEHDELDLSVEDAAKEVEEILVEKAKQYAGITKLKGAAAPTEEKKPLPSMRSKTITNDMTAPSGQKKPLPPLQAMSESDRYAEARRRAIAKIEAQKAGKTA